MKITVQLQLITIEYPWIIPILGWIPGRTTNARCFWNQQEHPRGENPSLDRW